MSFLYYNLTLNNVKSVQGYRSPFYQSLYSRGFFIAISHSPIDMEFKNKKKCLKKKKHT